MPLLPPAKMGYAYPFRGAVTTGRIDQGQDFGGSGDVLAIGSAKVVKIGAPGWPGGGGVLYRLLSGPLQGKYIYQYEGIQPTVRVGQVLSPGQMVGKIIPGTLTGIEWGFADAQGVPLAHGEYTEGKPTKFGNIAAGWIAALKKGHEFQESPTNIPSDIHKARSAVEGLPGEIVSGIAGIFGEHAESFALNLVLLLGGAFLVYYGAAMMLGVRSPAAKLTTGLAMGATKGAVK